MAKTLTTAFLSLGIGFAAQLVQTWFQNEYFTNFLKANLIILLVALLAVNSATLGIVITRIRDLNDKHGNGDTFAKTYREILLSIKEQVALICIAALLLTALDSPVLVDIPYFQFFVKAATGATFAYAITILYDIAKSALITDDLNQNQF
jgi:hypothetical protein